MSTAKTTRSKSKNVSRETFVKRTPPVNQKDYWQMIKEAFGENPKDVNGQLNVRTELYRQVLTNIVKGCFDIKCPEDWSKDYMLNLLIFKGRFFVTNSSVGIMPFDGSPHGNNLFLRAPKLTVTNAVVPTFERLLYGKKKNAVVVYLYDDKWYRGMSPLIDVYAEKLASCDCSIDVNLLNTRVPWIFNVADSRQAEEAKLVYTKASRGDPAIFTKVKDPMQPDAGGVEVTSFPVKEFYIADAVTELKRAIIAEFLTYVGINSNSYEKKERLITAEVDSNNEERDYNIAYPQNNLKECSEKVRKMFGIDFDIRMVDRDAENKKSVCENLHQEVDQKRDDSRNNQR